MTVLEPQSAPSPLGEDDATTLLQALVRQPTENPPGDVDDAVEALAAWFAARGAPLERHPVPDPFARHHGRAGLTNLIVRHRFGDGPTLVLHAPLDTVPAGSGWANDPFEGLIRDGRLIGRGAADAKGSLVAFIAAMERIVAAAPGRGALELHVTADEESGGALGPAFLVSQGLTSPSAVISAGSAHQVVIGQDGVLHLEVILRGRQAHAARRHEGRDAISAAVPLMAALQHEPVVISTVRGGRGENVVADRLRFTVDRRLSAGEDGEAVEAALIARLEGVHSAVGVELECRRRLLAEPVIPTPAAEALAAIVCEEAGRVMEKPVATVSAPVVSSARLYAHAGIPTALYGAGPPTVAEGVDAAQDEYVVLSDVAAASRAVSAAALKILASR